AVSGLLDNNPTILKLSPLLQMVLLGILSILLVRIFSRRPITRGDLCYQKDHLTKTDLIIIIAVFVITMLSFAVLSKLGSVTTDVKKEFTAAGFGEGFLSDFVIIVSSTLLAPIVEELVYRGIMLRSIHDGIRRFTPETNSLLSIPVILSITYTAIAFIMPHVSYMNIGVITISYFITSAGFSLVYILTGSMLAAMVSHSLQSCYTFSVILVLGHGDYAVSPIVYGISFLCPILVFFLGRILRGSFTDTSKCEKELSS
ncbi:MAG: type II CAAX endopeptidase family protein, partial [Tissierellia bacterium]|nr:type II CAAX endopeptidase family protein [Tissierellia bacterium]